MAMIDQFSDYQRARGFSPNTVARRRTAVEGFRKFMQPAGLEDATAMDVEEWLLTKPTAKTRHAYRSDLRQFYEWARRRVGWTVNPVTDTDPIKVPKSLPRPIGPEVYVALNTGRMRVRRMVALGMYAGLRCAEIAALEAGDIWLHQEPPVLVVRHGKGGKDRVVGVNPELIPYLKGIPKSGPLFPGQRGRGHVSAGSVSALLSRHLRRCGIEATPHQLRHTFGTEMARQARGNLVAVAAAMGHETTQTTMGYVGWSGESAEIIAAMFKPSPPPAA